MITFCDTPHGSTLPTGSFWILNDKKNDALQVAGGKVTRYRLKNNDWKLLVPISFSTLMCRLDNYRITPPELIKQVEQL